MTTSVTDQVLAAFEAGASSLSAIATDTGLSPDLVSLVVVELTRLGLLKQESLSSGCPTEGGCGTCAVSSADGSPCATGPAASRGPVLITLARPRVD